MQENSSSTASTPRRERIWTKDFLTLGATSLFLFITMQALNSGYSVYLVQRGHPAALAGTVMLIFSIAAVVMRFVTGYIIDRHGRWPMMILGTGMFAFSCFLGVIFPQVETLFPIRVLQGIGFAAATTAGSTAAADVLPNRRLGEGLGYFYLAPSLGMAVGPLLGTTLALSDNDTMFYIGTAALCTISLVIAFAARYEKHPERLDETAAFRVRFEKTGSIIAKQPSADEKKEPLAAQLFARSALPAAVPMFIANFALTIFMTYVALFGTQRGIANTGIFFTTVAISMIITRFLGGRLFDIAPYRVLFAAITITIVAGFVLLLLAHDTVMLAIAGLFAGAGIGMTLPLLNTIAMRCTSPSKWGAATATVNIALDMGSGLGALIWGVVMDIWSMEVVMLGGIVFMLLAFVAAMIMFPRKGMCAD